MKNYDKIEELEEKIKLLKHYHQSFFAKEIEQYEKQSEKLKDKNKIIINLPLS